MAVNLYQQADATIATAAARAGMALAPADYSTTFQNMATGYAKGMEKVGKGLAAAAGVATIAATKLVEDAKLAKETYGQEWMSTVYGDMKGLIRDGIDIIKGQSSTRDEFGQLQTTKFTDDSADGGLSIDEKKAQAKLDWKNKKTRAFTTFKKMRDGTLGIEELLKNGNVNLNALSATDSLMAQGLMAKGDVIKGGQFDGCRVSMERDESGEGYVFKVYDKDGKAVSGVHPETGRLEYLDGSDIIPIRQDQRAEDAKVNNATVNKYLKNESLEGNLRGTRLNPMNMDAYEIQRFLKDRGYDLGKTGEDGDGLDAIWGPKTQAAWDKFKQESSPAPITNNDIMNSLQIAGGRSQLSITADQVNNLVVTKETDKLIALNKIDLDNLAYGNQGLEFRENEVKNQTRALIDTPNAFRDLTHTNLGNMQYTYAEQLGMPNQWTAGMLLQVQRMGADGLIQDTNKDGLFDAGDFQEADYENFKVLRNEMLNPHSHAAKELFVDWFTNGVKQSHAAGANKYNIKNAPTGGDDNNTFVPLTRNTNPTGMSGQIDWKSKSMMNNIGRDMVERKPITSLDENNPITYVWDTNKNSYVDPSDGLPLTKEDLFNNVLGSPITNDFMMEDYYKSIPGWTSYSSGGGGGGSGAGQADFSGLTTEGWETESIIASDNKLSGDYILFNYGNGNFVRNTLTREYGDLGFKFKTHAMQDKLTVTFVNKAGDEVSESFTYNHISHKTDLSEAKRLQQWMQTAYEGGTGAQYNT